MSSPEDQTLTMPASCILASPGFAIDFGGSAIKIMYRTTEDNVKATETNSSSEAGSTVHLTSFPVTEMDAALSHIKTKCHIRRSPDGAATRVYSTGIGAAEHLQKINEFLNVDLQILPEFDCFVKSFRTLRANVSNEELLFPIKKPIVDECNLVAVGLLDYFKAQDAEGPSMAIYYGNENVDMSNELEAATATNIYPCILVSCGSITGVMKVPEEGTYEYVEESTRGGRMILGLANLLLNAKSFGDLVALAAEGDERALDISATDYNADQSGGGYYQGFPDEYTFFSFGKAADPTKDISSFRREDLAKAVLVNTIRDIVSTVHLTALSSGVKRVFFSGGLVMNEMVRDIITREFTLRKLVKGQSRHVDFQFVRNASHLGAIGAFLWE